MKEIRILLGVFLVAGLLMATLPVAAAAPPDLDVDIGIVGDNADVDIDIIGDNANVEINGQVPFVTYRSSSTSKWAKNTIKEDIFPWMANTENIVTLTMDGLAKVILLAQTNEIRLEEQATEAECQLVEQDSILANLNNKVDTEIGSLQSQVSELESQNKAQSARIDYQSGYTESLRAYYNIWLLVLSISLATLGGFSIYLLRRRY